MLCESVDAFHVIKEERVKGLKLCVWRMMLWASGSFGGYLKGGIQEV